MTNKVAYIMFHIKCNKTYITLQWNNESYIFYLNSSKMLATLEINFPFDKRGEMYFEYNHILHYNVFISQSITMYKRGLHYHCYLVYIFVCLCMCVN